MYLELGLGELKPSNCTLELADRSVRILTGRIDDVLVQINNGYFPVDFVVLDRILVKLLSKSLLF